VNDLAASVQDMKDLIFATPSKFSQTQVDLFVVVLPPLLMIL